MDLSVKFYTINWSTYLDFYLSSFSDCCKHCHKFIGNQKTPQKR
jgi:hypothetical protein